MRWPIIAATLLVAQTAQTARSAHAQLTLRNSAVVEGAYSTIGNLLIDCPGAGTGTCNNNDVAMAPVDVDQDSTTTMSSAATLALPANAAVRSAVLYVTGSGSIDVAGTPGPAWLPPDDASLTVRLAPPGAQYTTLTPERVDRLSGVAYLARYDVTSLVASSGEYLVADAYMIPASHPYNRVLSWVLFVTYEDGSPPRLINLYDGYLNCFMGSTTITLSGFRTPAAGMPRALFTAWSVDGHPTLPGESITIGTRALSNAQNPVNNLGNSTVSSPTGPIARRPATFRVTEEMDLDTFDASNAFTASQTSANITFTCGTQEGVVYHMAVLGVEVVAPSIVLSKAVSDVNGGSIVAGDELQYELRAAVTGGDDAIDVVLRDVLPEGLSFVPGSISIGGVAKTDQAGDDQAEWTGSDVVARLGAGATSTIGGTIAVGAGEVVRFNALVDSATIARTIVNQASLTARGAQGGSGSTLVEVSSSTVGVEALPCEGFMSGMCPDAGVVEDATVEDAGFEDLGLAEDARAAEDAAEIDRGVAEDAAASPDANPDATTNRDAATADASAPRDAGVSAADAGSSEDGDGCGCSTTNRGRNSAIGLFLLALALFTRRRH